MYSTYVYSYWLLVSGWFCYCTDILCSQVHEFFDFVGESSFYGAQKGESVESLALSILPTPDFKFTKLEQEAGTTTLQLAEEVLEEQEAENGPVVLLTALINTLQKDAGFNFIKVEELAMVSVHDCVYTYCTYRMARNFGGLLKFWHFGRIYFGGWEASYHNEGTKVLKCTKVICTKV